MIRRFPHMPLILGWAACAALAFLGAYAQGAISAGLWVSAAIVLYAYASQREYTVRKRLRHFQADCDFHEWAHHTMFIVTDKTGKRWYWNLDELRYAGDLLWDEPIATAVYNAEWLKQEEGQQHA